MKTEKDSKEKEKMQKELNTKYTELQMIDQQIRQIQQQTHMLQQQSAELELVKNILDEFANVEKGSEGYVTLTPGILVKAKIEKTEGVLLNVGSGAMAEKTIPETKKLLDKQIDELKKTENELTTEIDKLVTKAQKTEGELNKLIKNV